MGNRPERRARLFWLVVAVWSLAALSAVVPAALAQEPGRRAGGPSFEYRKSADAVVLRYAETLSAYKAEDSGRSVVVYGDGRVVVHYPAVMKRAGDYTLQLSPAELRELLGRVVDRDFVDLDEAKARQPRKRKGEAGGSEAPELFAVFDEATSTIELNLDSYRTAGSQAVARRNVKRSVRYYALRAYANRYRENAPLQNLAAVQHELMALLEREDLERIE